MNKNDKIIDLIDQLKAEIVKSHEDLVTDDSIKFQRGGIVCPDKYAVLFIKTQHGFSVDIYGTGEVHSRCKLEACSRRDVGRGDIVYMSPFAWSEFTHLENYYLILDSTWAVHWDEDGSAVKTDESSLHIWKVIL